MKTLFFFFFFFFPAFLLSFFELSSRSLFPRPCLYRYPLPYLLPLFYLCLSFFLLLLLLFFFFSPILCSRAPPTHPPPLDSPRNPGCGRHAQAKNTNAHGSQVGWPVKSVAHFVSLLTNVAANAELKGLDVDACSIVHVQANAAVKQRPDRKSTAQLPAIDKSQQAEQSQKSQPPPPPQQQEPSAQDREKRHHHHRHQHENNPEFEDADTVDAAYTWFSRIDADGSGRISVREVARILAGHMEYQFDVTFPMADTGLTFGNDEHNHLRIVDIEHESPADLHPDMMRGLTLTRVNGEELGTDKKNLLKLNKFLRGIEDGIPTRFSFTEPSFIVSEYGNMIDIRLHDDHDGGLHSVRMPPGAYTYDAEFVSTLETKIHETHEDLRFIKVHYNRKTHRISFKAADHKTEFMLCFKHGPQVFDLLLAPKT